MRQHLEKLNVLQLRNILKQYNHIVKVNSIYKLNKHELITVILNHLDVSIKAWSNDGFPILGFNPQEKSLRSIGLDLLKSNRNIVATRRAKKKVKKDRKQ